MELFWFLIRSTVSVSPRMWHLITFLTYLKSWQGETSNHLKIWMLNPTEEDLNICICYFQCNFPCCLETDCRVQNDIYLWKLYFTGWKDTNYGLNLVEPDMQDWHRVYLSPDGLTDLRIRLIHEMAWLKDHVIFGSNSTAKILLFTL